MFALQATDGRARAGLLDGIATPVFMPVGTRGSVRTQTPAQLEALGAPIILANTYHLHVRPGRALFEQMGGLHRWMGWTRKILTDSGGYQMYSLGDPDLLTPEESIAMQCALGSDIMMALDRCIDATAPYAHARAAVELTRDWAKRSRAASPRTMFGIVQGACYPDLRRESAAHILDIGFDGYAIGGLAVGETKAQREDMTELTTELLPAHRARYLMGVGTPIDLLEATHRGVDMFDCILPTAVAQHGVAFTSHGKLDLRRGVHRTADRPLDAACTCEACRHSRSYLHHLVKCGEPLGWQLLAHHNLAFYLQLAREMRAAIVAKTWSAFYAAKREVLAAVDPDNPPGKKPKQRRGTPTTRGDFTLVFAGHGGDGFTSIRHVPSGEIMHSVNEPDDEARRVYVEQSVAIASGREIVVWDVGLGAAHNAMAVVRNGGPVALHSFELDLDAFHLALAHTKHFPHVRHAAPHVLAQRGHYAHDRLTWTLHRGDFLETFRDAPQPDVILYDPFSSKTNTELWSLATFERLFAHLAKPCELFTYSASTAVRSSLLAAGFAVARGVASGPKLETTIAFTRVTPATRHQLLGRAWLEKRARSTAPFGADIPPERYGELDTVIRSRPQFTANLAAD